MSYFCQLLCYTVFEVIYECWRTKPNICPKTLHYYMGAIFKALEGTTMKFLQAIISILFLAGCGQIESGRFTTTTKFPKTVHLLIAGQSNGNSNIQDSALQVGLGQHELPYAPPMANAIINEFSGSSSHWQPTPSKPSIFGLAWLHIAEFEPGHNFFITVASCAGSSTQQQVDNGYYRLILNALAVQRYDAVLWVQGEADSGLHMSTAQTYNNMVQIINLSRLAQPDLIWYVALDGPADQATRNAQKQLVANGYALQGPDVDVMRSNPAFVEAYGAEFSGAGLKEHGRLWDEVLKSRF